MASTKSRKNKAMHQQSPKTPEHKEYRSPSPQNQLPPELEEWLATLPPKKEAKERLIAKQNLNRIIHACPALVAEALATR